MILTKLEELQLDTFEVGKDKLRIVTIMPLDERDIEAACADAHAGAEEEPGGLNLST